MQIGPIEFFSKFLSALACSLGVRTLSFLLSHFGCVGSLAFAIGLFLRSALTAGVEEYMIPDEEGTSGTKRSGPARDGSPASSDSLIGHPSSETDSEKEEFLTPPQSEASSPNSTSSSESEPTTVDLNTLLSEERKKALMESCVDYFNKRLVEIDPYGKVGKIPEKEIMAAFRMDSIGLTIKDEKALLEALWLTPWPSYEEADRTSIYHRIWDLLEKHKRPAD